MRSGWLSEMSRKANWSPASRGILLLEEARETARDGEQDRIADGDAEAVVDLLEAIDVEDEDRRARRVLGVGARDRRTEPVEEQLAVGQAGEVVVDGVV
jgi:hypothetical protein